MFYVCTKLDDVTSHRTVILAEYSPSGGGGKQFAFRQFQIFFRTPYNEFSGCVDSSKFSVSFTSLHFLDSEAARSKYSRHAVALQ